MTHLPECWRTEGKFDAVCICDRLCACEQRVLDAARESLAGIPPGRYSIEDALAAIDALRQTPEVDEQEPN
jgi:hypothetical protein